MTHRKLLSLTALALVGALTLAGCSNDAEAPAKKSPSAAQTTSAPPLVPVPTEMPTEAPTEGPGVTPVEGNESFFGIVPEDIQIPLGIQEQFPDHASLVRATLAQQYSGAIFLDAQKIPEGEGYDALVMATILPSLSGPMQDQFKTDTAAAFTGDGNAWKQAFAVTPLSPPTGAFVIGEESFTVDNTRLWNIVLNNLVISKTDLGLSGIEGVVVEFDRFTNIPTTDAASDLMIPMRIALTMVPNGQGGWVIDGVNWNASPAEKVTRS